jgi:hypothetical protein
MGKQNRRFSVFFTHTTKRLIEKKPIFQGFLITQLGTNWNNGTNAGTFNWNVNNTPGNRNRNISSHLANARHKHPLKWYQGVFIIYCGSCLPCPLAKHQNSE